MNSEEIGKRMHEIMDARGMKPKDFYYDDDYKERDKELFTRSTFYSVLNGKTKNPRTEFVPLFCKIAGINVAEFYGLSQLPDEITCSLNEKGVNIILETRRLGDRVGYEMAYRIVSSFLDSVLVK